MYPEVGLSWLTQNLMDLENQGQCAAENISYQAFVLAKVIEKSDEMQALVAILCQCPSNIVALRSLLKLCKKSTEKLMFNMKDHSDFFDALASNLAKNSRTVRLLTLNILRRFQPINFAGSKSADGAEQYSEKKPCNCIELMYEFEKVEIGFHTERGKQA